MDLESGLRKEIEKWTERLEKELKKIKDDEENEFLTNIKAYLSDSKHFYDKKDLIRSFEAIIWAWAWLEIGKEIGKI